MIVEADKSLSASQENQWCSSNPIAGILETQVDLMFQLSSKGRKTPYVPAGRQAGSKNSLSMKESLPFYPI